MLQILILAKHYANVVDIDFSKNIMRTLQILILAKTLREWQLSILARTLRERCRYRF